MKPLRLTFGVSGGLLRAGLALSLGLGGLQLPCALAELPVELEIPSYKGPPLSDPGISEILTPKDKMADFVLEHVENNLFNLIDSLYQGISPDLTLSEMPPDATDLSKVSFTDPAEKDPEKRNKTFIGKAVTWPICALVGNPYLRKRRGRTGNEETANWAGHPCDTFATAKISISGAAGFFPTNFQTSLQPFPAGPARSWERAHLNSLWPHVLQFTFQDIQREVRAGKIKLSGATQKMAADIIETMEVHGPAAQGAMGELEAQAKSALSSGAGTQKELRQSMAKVEGGAGSFERFKCTARNAGLDAQGNYDVGGIRQKAQYLCAAWKGLQGAVINLVFVELISRARQNFLNVVPDGDTSALEQKIRADSGGDACIKAIGDYAKDQCVSGLSAFVNLVSAQINSCLTNKIAEKINVHPNCYETSVRNGFLSFVQSRWPISQ